MTVAHTGRRAGPATVGWIAETREFHLHNDSISYVIRVLENGTLGQVHFGAALATGKPYRHLSVGEFHGFSNRGGPPPTLEYPTPSSGDFRAPALTVRHEDGSTVLDLAYQAHRIIDGKPPATPASGKDSPVALPTTYTEHDDEAATLEIDLADTASGLEATLSYTIFRDVPAIARSARIRNSGKKASRIAAAMSATLDLPDSAWDFVHLSGAWARERHIVATPLRPGRQSVSSTRGSSSHQQNPFLVLRRAVTTEEHGEAYGFSLVYSGNFLAEAEVDPFGGTRVRLGIDPETFSWGLAPGAEFVTPEAVLVYSDAGLGALSDAYHQLYRERLARGPWRDKPRPVLINNWEGTYFDFDESKLLAIATVARDLGIELFVLDDGWFGKRDNDDSSLGDWFVDKRKLPAGIDGLARKVAALGIKFGLWIEPEMISEDSDLFRAHPDWAIGVPGRPRTQLRQQYHLDMSRPEIVDHLFSVLSDVLASGPVSYVKWDYNRYVTEPYSVSLPADRQGEFFHRQMLGTYDLYGRLTTAFPDILFESCAGGGGRFDPGLLAFAPQAWTSDDTDAVERLRIQWGTSLSYPLSSMAAHVSAVPNHQVGRIVSLTMRAAVAFFGVFGYELDSTALSEEERLEIADQVAFYKVNRDVFQYGRFVRLQSPFEGDGNVTAWMAASPDARRAVVGHYRVLNHPEQNGERLRLRGLEPSLTYRVSMWPSEADRVEGANSGLRGGDELMNVGLDLGAPKEDIARRGDFSARLFVLEAI